MNNTEKLKRIVVKVGTSTLTYENGALNFRRMEILARVLSDLQNGGREIILVTSAAISAGCSKLGFTRRPELVEEKRAAAAVGQCELMQIYERLFSVYGRNVAQILASKEIVDIPHVRGNAEKTFRTLIKFGCIPIVNENDTIAFDEYVIGDNDTLSAYVALICDADMLIILSDRDGLYDGDPRVNSGAKLISTVGEIDDIILGYAGGAGTDRGTGGFVTKLKAAKIVCENGIPMMILNGDNPEIIYDALEGKPVGTYFCPTVK